MSAHQNHINCSFCLASIQKIGSNAHNPKCDECSRKIDSVPSGFPFIMVNEITEYECPICLSLIETATELPCTHLMCEACLVFYENGEVEKHEDKAKFICSVCQAEYKPNKKKLVGSTDRVIQTSLLVKCLQEECNWTGCIMDYKYHEKDCKHILMNCQYANCEVKVQRQLMDSHVEGCSFRPIQCEYCEEMAVYKHLQEHHGQCPQFPVTCPNKDCLAALKRSEIKAHCKAECQFQQIDCLYSEVGCPFKGMRGKMHQHSEAFKFNHDFLLLKTVKYLKEKSDQGEEKLKERDLEIEQLNHKMEDLKIQLENVRQQTAIEIERNEAQTIDHFKEQSKRLEQCKEDIKNLQTFAERASKLHFTLSGRLLRENRHNDLTLLQEDYDKNKEVKEWRETTKEADEDDNECKYLRKLKDSINKYKGTIYCSTYKERFENFLHVTPQGVLCYPFVRIGCSVFTESICVKVFYNRTNFNNEVDRNGARRSCKIQNDHCVCSYYVGDCLNVVLRHSSKGIYLLHNSNEEEKLYLPHGKENINDIFKYWVQGSIVLYLSK